MTQPPHVVALLDQAAAAFGAELVRLTAAVAAGIAESGREQTINDFTALFNRSNDFNRVILAALLAQALADRAIGAGR